MTWYLLFCSHVYSGAQCLPPQKVESEAVCRALGDKMKDGAAIMSGAGWARCVGVRRP